MSIVETYQANPWLGDAMAVLRDVGIIAGGIIAAVFILALLVRQ